MIRTQLNVEGRPCCHLNHPTVEDSCDHVRTLLYSSIEETRIDMLPRQIITYTGIIPGTSIESMPRKSSKATTGMGLDAIALAAVLDRSVRLHHHPAIKGCKFNAENSPASITVTDVNGKVFEITVKEKE